MRVLSARRKRSIGKPAAPGVRYLKEMTEAEKAEILSCIKDEGIESTIKRYNLHRRSLGAYLGAINNYMKEEVKQ